MSSEIAGGWPRLSAAVIRLPPQPADLLSIMRNAGVMIADEKTVGPSTFLTVLHKVDSRAMSEQIRRVKDLLHLWRGKKHGFCQSLVGFTTRCKGRPVRLHLLTSPI